MPITRFNNTIYGPHLVNPDRVIVPVQKPFDAPAGAIPFHRMLEQLNRVQSVSASVLHNAQIETPSTKIVRAADTWTPSDSLRVRNELNNTPNLGEVLPTKPKSIVTKTTNLNSKQEIVLSTPLGKMIDVYT